MNRNELIGNRVLRCSLPAAVEVEAVSGRDRPWWNEFLRVAVREGLAESIFYHQNRSALASQCPADVFRALDSEYVTTLARNTFFLKQADDLKKTLEGCDYILLKGAFLADCVYPSPGMRRFSDIDVLVRKRDREAVGERLRTRGGYRLSSGVTSGDDESYLNSATYGRDGQGAAVHVHWHIQNSILPKYVGRGFDIEELWKAAQPSSTASFELRPEHLVLHLADHALRHSFQRLIHVRDVIEVVRWAGPRWNWTVLRDEAMRFGLARPLYYTLRLIDARGGMAVDRDILGSLEPPRRGFLERRYEKDLITDRRRAEASNIVYGADLPKWTDRIRFAYRLLFPPRVVLAAAYGRKPEDIGVRDYAARLLRGLRHLWG